MRMQKLVDKLQSRVNVIMKGGGEKAVARHTSRGNSTTTYVYKQGFSSFIFAKNLSFLKIFQIGSKQKALFNVFNLHSDSIHSLH